MVIVALYSLYQLARTLISIIQLKRGAATATLGASSDPSRARTTERRLASLGSLNLFAFYLFALLFFVSQMPDAFTTYGLSRETGASIIIRQVGVHFSFAADVLLLLLALHLLRWIVSSWFFRVRDTALIIH